MMYLLYHKFEVLSRGFSDFFSKVFTLYCLFSSWFSLSWNNYSIAQTWRFVNTLFLKNGKDFCGFPLTFSTARMSTPVGVDYSWAPTTIPQRAFPTLIPKASNLSQPTGSAELSHCLAHSLGTIIVYSIFAVFAIGRTQQIMS